MPENVINQPAQTYILIGDNILTSDDPLQAQWAKKRKEVVEEAERRGVIVLSSKQYPKIEDALGQIKPPANVIVFTHGFEESGYSEWTHGAYPSYGEIFEKLPTGTSSVSIASCYGGTGEVDQFLQKAPPGLMVQSFVGPQTNDDEHTPLNVIGKTGKESRAVDTFLSALGSFDPHKFHDEVEKAERDGKSDLSGKYQNLDSNPTHALPHIIGFGRGGTIDIAQEMAQLKDEDIPSDKWQQIVSDAKEKFGAQTGKAFDRIASKLRRGEILGSGRDRFQAADELRIGYAITVSKLNLMGDLDARCEIALKGGVQETALPFTTKGESNAASNAMDRLGLKLLGMQESGAGSVEIADYLKSSMGFTPEEIKTLGNKEAEKRAKAFVAKMRSSHTATPDQKALCQILEDTSGRWSGSAGMPLIKNLGAKTASSAPVSGTSNALPPDDNKGNPSPSSPASANPMPGDGDMKTGRAADSSANPIPQSPRNAINSDIAKKRANMRFYLAKELGGATRNGARHSGAVSTDNVPSQAESLVGQKPPHPKTVNPSLH